MLPLTLGHLFLLAERDIGPGYGINATELPVAVFICSRSVEEARRWLDSRWLRLAFGIWGRRNHKLGLSAGLEAVKFCDWLFEQMQGPKVHSDENAKDDDYAAPARYSLLALAMGKLNLSQSDAMTMPVRELRKLLVAFGEATGTLKPFTWNDEYKSRLAEKVKSKLAKGEQP